MILTQRGLPHQATSDSHVLRIKLFGDRRFKNRKLVDEVLSPFNAWMFSVYTMRERRTRWNSYLFSAAIYGAGRFDGNSLNMTLRLVLV